MLALKSMNTVTALQIYNYWGKETKLIPLVNTPVIASMETSSRDSIAKVQRRR